MRTQRLTAVVTATIIAASAFAATTAPADAAATGKWKNCSAFNNAYPHGVGRTHAHDHVSSGHPVTNFRHSTTLFNRAMSHNKSLDRDKDHVACEKH